MNWFHRPLIRPVLSNLHTGIWWGAILLIIGLVYFIRFYPKKSNGKQ